MRLNRSLFLLVLLFPTLLFSTDSPANPQQGEYLALLQKKAATLKLHTKKRWLKLGHYKPNIFGGYTSEADGPKFFNDKNGRKDPAAELKATLAVFFAPAILNPNELHPQCRFIARYHWLNKHLEFDKNKLAHQPCPRFNQWKRSINPESVTIVFSSFFINSPVSAMGHTLLKLNKKRAGQKQALLDYGVNYAANADLANTNFVVYAVAGIFGGYPGTFAIYPYYLKVNEYNNSESRDLWEYKLDLNQQEVDILVEHLWEMGSTYFDYFYFDENCSYQLLSLIEVARPDVELTDDFFYVVQPMDTIRLLQKKKLIVDAVYRPSQLSKFRQKYYSLSYEDQDAVKDLVKDGKTLPGDLDAAKRTLLLDTAIDYMGFRKFDQKTLDKDAAAIYNKLLLARSKITTPVSKKEYKPLPDSVNPVIGHHTTTARLSAGYSSKGAYGEVMYRPALRQVSDNPLGYAPYSQILFFSTSFRFHEQSDEVPQLNYFRMVDVLSMAPYRRLFKRISWTVSTGFENRRNEFGGEINPYQIYYYLYAGAGLSFKPERWGILNRVLLFFFVKPRFEAASSFENWVRFGPENEAGLIIRTSKYSQLIAAMKARWFVAGTEELLPIASATFNYRLGPSFAFEFTYEHFLESRYYETGTSLKYYF